MRDVFKIHGIKREYKTIPEMVKAGFRQYKIKKKKLAAYAYNPTDGSTEVGYFTKDPYSDDLLFIGKEYYDSNGDQVRMLSYRMNPKGSIQLLRGVIR